MKGPRPNLPRQRLGRDVGVAVALFVVIVALLLFGGSAKGRGASEEAAGTYHDSKDRVEARIPTGWRAILRPIDGVTYPPQVLAAASYRVRVPHQLRGCHPGSVLAQMPEDGVLLKVFEYARRDPFGKPVRVPHLPPRPRRFSYRDAEYGPFECAGTSYKFTFEQGGRAFQAHVWFERRTVDPRLRAQALQILDSFRPTKRAGYSRYSAARPADEERRPSFRLVAAGDERFPVGPQERRRQGEGPGPARMQGRVCRRARVRCPSCRGEDLRTQRAWPAPACRRWAGRQRALIEGC